MKRLATFEEISTPSISSYTPYTHQLEAIEGIISTFKTCDRAHVVMACGTGKTSVCLWTAERLNVHRIVIFLPSLALINQTLHEWIAVTKWKNVSQLIVCSDHTVTHGVEEPLIDLEASNYPVTTCSLEINDFLKRERKGPLIVFCTYQSSSMLAQGMKNCKAFDLGIFDEAHRTTGTKDRQFNLGISNKYIKIDKRLFVTATPRHFKLHKSSKEKRTSIYSMDSEKFYGPLAYRLSFREAIQRDLISDYKVIISAVVNKPELKNIDTWHWDQNAIALQKAINLCKAKKIITFHRSILDAEQFVDNLNLKGYLPETRSFHINSFMPVRDRMNIMNLFKNTEGAVVSNARCLTEGTNVPAVDMVAFLSPKQSKIDIVQAIGRALRKSKDKTTGYIFLPLFVDLKENETLEEAIKRADYGDIWEVLEALSEYDEDLHSTIRFLQINKKRPNAIGPAGLDKYIRIISSEADLKFKINLKKSIEVSIVDKLGSSWDEMYGQLAAYYDIHGNARVPNRYKKNPSLAIWVQNQRNNFKNDSLSKDRILLLNKIDFTWYPYDHNWNENFEKLKIFKKKHHHCNVPMKYKPDIYLGYWVGTQRDRYKRNLISKSQIKMLDSIGFQWTLANNNDIFWNKNYQKLLNFKKKYHHCNVPTRYEPDISFSSWVTAQRVRRKKKLISKSRIKMLDSIGFQWSVKDNAWINKYQELVNFKKKCHHCNVPLKYETNISLGIWVATQRARYKNKLMAKSQIKMLNSIGFQWSLANNDDIAWKNKYQKLVNFKKKHHHCNVPTRYKPDISLSRWAAKQRYQYKDKLINKSRIKMLESIGFQWSLPDHNDIAWEKRYQELVDFKKKHHHCNVPTRYKPNISLGGWVAHQRNRYRHNLINKSQIAMLNSIGFQWSLADKNDIAWKKIYSDLVDFNKKNGHCNIPKRSKRFSQLAAWIIKQRKLFRENALPQQRIKLLNKIGFTWDPFEQVWNDNFLKLKQYIKINKHMFVREKEDIYLVSWMRTQRKKLRDNTATKKQAALLKSINFTSDNKKNKITYYEK